MQRAQMCVIEVMMGGEKYEQIHTLFSKLSDRRVHMSEDQWRSQNFGLGGLSPLYSQLKPHVIRATLLLTEKNYFSKISLEGLKSF